MSGAVFVDFLDDGRGGRHKKWPCGVSGASGYTGVWLRVHLGFFILWLGFGGSGWDSLGFD